MGQTERLVKAENVLYAYACGLMKARAVREELASLGFQADLRCWVHNAIELIDMRSPEQEYVEVRI